MDYNEVLAEHTAAIKAITSDVQALHGPTAAHLLASVHPNTAQALITAQAAYEEAVAAHDAAAQRLAQHDNAKPALLGNVTQWAKARGALTDELHAYTALLQERHATLDTARRAELSERTTAWLAFKDHTEQQNRAASAAAITDIQTAMIDVERAKGRQNQAVHKTMMLTNMIDAMKPI